MRGVIDFAIGILVIILLFYMVVMINFIAPESLLHSRVKEYRVIMEGIIIQQNINHILNTRVNRSNNLRVIDYTIGLRNCVEKNNKNCTDYYLNELTNLSEHLLDHGVVWGFYLGNAQVAPLECERAYYYFGGKIPIGFCKPKVV